MAKTQNTIAVSSEWPITAKRYVGFIDIMGFKDLVARSTHEEIYVMMQKIKNAIRPSESIEGPETRSLK